MAIASLLKVNPLIWKHSFLEIQSPPPNIRQRGRSNLAACYINKAAKFNCYCCCSAKTTATTTTTAKFSIKCFITKKQKQSSSSSSSDEYSKETSANPLDVVADAILHVLRKPAVVVVLLGVLLMYDPYCSAWAASGGRMGGSSFSSSSSPSSSSSSSSSYSSSSSWSSDDEEDSSSSGLTCLLLLGIIAIACVLIYVAAIPKTSVVKFQVGLPSNQSVQSNLNRIAEVADTFTPEGLNYVLTETTLALLRQLDYCILSCSSVDIKWGMEGCEERFHQLSMEERGKVDEETLVNVNNIKRLSITRQRDSGFNNEYLVITILVAAKGVYKLPTINNSGDLKEALQKLGSIPSSKTLAVEVLWTPQNENDTLSKQKLQEDYPLLRPLEQHSTA